MVSSPTSSGICAGGSDAARAARRSAVAARRRTASKRRPGAATTSAPPPTARSSRSCRTVSTEPTPRPMRRMPRRFSRPTSAAAATTTDPILSHPCARLQAAAMRMSGSAGATREGKDACSHIPPTTISSRSGSPPWPRRSMSREASAKDPPRGAARAARRSRGRRAREQKTRHAPEVRQPAAGCGDRGPRHGGDARSRPGAVRQARHRRVDRTAAGSSDHG
jgi:hypothetical protein